MPILQLSKLVDLFPFPHPQHLAQHHINPMMVNKAVKITPTIKVPKNLALPSRISVIVSLASSPKMKQKSILSNYLFSWNCLVNQDKNIPRKMSSIESGSSIILSRISCGNRFPGIKWSKNMLENLNTVFSNSLLL